MSTPEVSPTSECHIRSEADSLALACLRTAHHAWEKQAAEWPTGQRGRQAQLSSASRSLMAARIVANRLGWSWSALSRATDQHRNTHRWQHAKFGEALFPGVGVGVVRPVDLALYAPADKVGALAARPVNDPGVPQVPFPEAVATVSSQVSDVAMLATLGLAGVNVDPVAVLEVGVSAERQAAARMVEFALSNPKARLTLDELERAAGLHTTGQQ